MMHRQDPAGDERTNVEHLAEEAGYQRKDFSVCLGCKICGSVCTINDLSISANPQSLLSAIFMGREVKTDDPLLLYCTSCYNCTSACPWHIRVPEIVRAIKNRMGLETPFERAFKSSVRLLGRVYEPYVFIKSLSFLMRGGYLAYAARWKGYINVHLPHKVKGLRAALWADADERKTR